MNNRHVIEQLQAYHDGELRGRALQRVETHLSECAECRARLDQLEALRALLLGDALPAGLADAPRFVSEVNLKLQRREQVAKSPARVWQAGWYLVPVGLLGLWAIWEASRLTASVVALALSLEWLPDIVPPSASAAQLLVINVVLPTALMLMCAGWLASWWTTRAARSNAPDGADSQNRNG